MLIVFQHPMDGMQQFVHDSADSLERFLPVIHEVLEIGFDIWVVLFGAQGRHVKGCPYMSVAGLGQTCLFVDAFAGIECAWVKACELYPFTIRKARW